MSISYVLKCRSLSIAGFAHSLPATSTLHWANTISSGSGGGNKRQRRQHLSLVSLGHTVASPSTNTDGTPSPTTTKTRDQDSERPSKRQRTIDLQGNSDLHQSTVLAGSNAAISVALADIKKHLTLSGCPEIKLSRPS